MYIEKNVPQLENTKEQLRSYLPNGYESTAFYGLTVVKIPPLTFGQSNTYALVWGSAHQTVVERLKTKLDVWGDSVLRRTDYHIPNRPLKTFLRHPKKMMELVTQPAICQRGEPADTWERIKSLGLTIHYSEYKENGVLTGIAVRDKSTFENRISLWDILDHQELVEIDRTNAYEQVGKYTAELQEKNPYLMNLNPWDFLFERNGEDVSSPLLSIPDISANKDKLTEGEAKTYAFLSLVLNIVQLELHSSQKTDPKTRETNARQALQTLFHSYGDNGVVERVQTFNRRGRISLADTQAIEFPDQKPQSLLSKLDRSIRTGVSLWASIHPTASFRVTKEESPTIRQIIDEEITYYLSQRSA